MPFRILSYNVHGGRGMDRKQDYKRIHSLLLSHSIDIALLQEFDTRPSLRDTEQDIRDICGEKYSHFFAGKAIEGKYGWYGNAILSQFPIIEKNLIDVSHPKREPRNIMEAFIETPQGLVHILNTHKGLNKKERRFQLEKLHKLLVSDSSIPLIVAGDINEWQSSSLALKDLNTTLHPVPVQATYPTFLPIFHLDRVWCRPDSLVKKAFVLKDRYTRVFSDHFPVLVEI